jgi:2-phosphosulfolactate phosphatase
MLVLGMTPSDAWTCPSKPRLAFTNTLMMSTDSVSYFTHRRVQPGFRQPLLKRIDMEISIHSLLEGATRATGSVAVIDVFRAFTSAAVALANGASRIVMVRTVDEALALREAGTGQICMGEVRGQAPDGFDFGNSPFEISGVDFGGKTIIQRTSAGTQGIVAAATKAKRLYAASLVTADATVRALLSSSPDHVSLVAMGEDGLKRTDEDELCAIHLRNRLEGRPGDPDAIRRLILAGGEVRRFHDPSRPYLHREDVDIALDIDRYDFAIRVEFENGRPVARMERPT